MLEEFYSEYGPEDNDGHWPVREQLLTDGGEFQPGHDDIPGGGKVTVIVAHLDARYPSFVKSLLPPQCGGIHHDFQRRRPVMITSSE